MPRCDNGVCYLRNHAGRIAFYLVAVGLSVLLLAGCASPLVKKPKKLDGGCLMQGGVTYPCPPMA